MHDGVERGGGKDGVCWSLVSEIVLVWVSSVCVWGGGGGISQHLQVETGASCLCGDEKQEYRRVAVKLFHEFVTLACGCVPVKTKVILTSKVLLQRVKQLHRS
jgi:hypothetical protein